MPAVTQVVLYDDEAWPERVKADEIVQVSIVRQPVSGGSPVRRAAELYLTGARAAELDKSLDYWFGIGHKSGGSPVQGREPPGLAVNWDGGTRQASVDRRRKIREFLTERDVRSRVDPSRLAFMTPAGSWSYPKWAVAMYDQWVADGRPALGKAS
jgi:hypothetical protein